MHAKAFIAALLIAVCLCSCKGAAAYGSSAGSSLKFAEGYESQNETNKKTDNTVTEKGIFGNTAQKNTSETESTEKGEKVQNEDKVSKEEPAGTDTVGTEILNPSDTSSEQKDEENYVNTDGYGSIIP